MTFFFSECDGETLFASEGMNRICEEAICDLLDYDAKTCPICCNQSSSYSRTTRPVW